MILDGGSDAVIRCENCSTFRRRCIVAIFSRRRAECVRRSRVCRFPSATSPSPSSILDREIAIRSEIAALFARLRACFLELDFLTASASLSHDAHIDVPNQDN